MTAPRLAGLAARYIGRTADRLRRPDAALSRARGVAVIEAALCRRARRRVWLHGLLGVAAVAAVAVVPVVLTRRAAAPIPVAGAPPGSKASGVVDIISEGRSLRPGDAVSTPAGGGVEMALSTGTRIHLEERTDVVIQGAGLLEAFSLAKGAIDLSVAKLSPSQRFVVHTPDAEVEVRGTQFRVRVLAPDPSCPEDTVTRVDVTEGLVAVRHLQSETLVGPGQSWPPACAPASPSSSATSGSTSQAPPAPRPSVSASAATSTLTEQNELFARAIAAKQRGDSPEAIADFEMLLTKYPASPLAEGAAAERMRLLNAVDRHRGADAAREYLRRYPRGLVRAEAQAIAEEMQ